MSSRVRKQVDCPVSKQGPMRATLPVSSVMKQSGGFKKNTGSSPTLSPTNIWRRVSPDAALSGQRSPGALNYKAKARFDTSVIRRTASLDNLYHKSHWSRDFYIQPGHLQLDKSTQTDDGGASGRSSRGSEDDKLDRFLRSRLQRPHKQSGSGDSPHSVSPGFWSRFGSSGSVPLRAARSSVEGLNQEIERLVFCPASGTQTPYIDRQRDKQMTPEGHRAPLAEMLRRSVNTQTPHDLCTTHSSGGSVCSSPDMDGARFGTSPQINRFLAREPPDGCEKVNLKTGEGAFEPVSPIKPAVAGFTLRPSLGSAFQPLQPSVPSTPPATTPH